MTVRLFHNVAISTNQFRSVLKTFLWSWKEGSKKFQVDYWRFVISTLLLHYFFKKRLNLGHFSQKMDFFQVFRGEMKILMVVLESASKMRWTIREDFSIWLFFKKKNFFLEFSTIFHFKNPKKKNFAKIFDFLKYPREWFISFLTLISNLPS